MKRAYVNCRIVLAYPKENGDLEGYAIEYPSGYTSWCPKKAFERDFRLINIDEKDLINSVEADVAE